MCGQETCLSWPLQLEWTTGDSTHLTPPSPGAKVWQSPLLLGAKDTRMRLFAQMHILFLSWHMATCSSSQRKGAFEPRDASEPSGTAYRAAAPWSQPIKSTEYMTGGFVLVVWGFFKLRMRKCLTLFTSLTDCEAFSHVWRHIWHILEVLPFLAWIIHTFRNALERPKPSVSLLLPKMLAKSFGARHHAECMF